MTFRAGLSRPKGCAFPIAAWLIMLYERVWFSHTYIRFKTKNGKWLTYHATHRGLTFIGELAFNEKIRIVEEYELEVSELYYQVGIDFCIDYAGLDYAYTELLGIVVADLLKLSRNPFSQGIMQMYCAEVVARFMGKIGKQLKVDANRVKLKDIQSFLKSNGRRIK